MHDEKAPSSGPFLPPSLMYFCSGKPMHLYSGVDTVEPTAQGTVYAYRCPKGHRQELAMAKKVGCREVIRRLIRLWADLKQWWDSRHERAAYSRI
jgi:hypothetical protein